MKLCERCKVWKPDANFYNPEETRGRPETRNEVDKVWQRRRRGRCVQCRTSGIDRIPEKLWSKRIASPSVEERRSPEAQALVELTRLERAAREVRGTGLLGRPYTRCPNGYVSSSRGARAEG